MFGLNHLRAHFPKCEAQAKTLSPPFDGHFQRVGLDLVWYDRTVSYGLDYDTRTIGMLVYSRYLPTMSAMSGSNHYLPHPQTLDNRVWTFKVRDLCAVIGFDLQLLDSWFRKISRLVTVTLRSSMVLDLLCPHKNRRRDL